MGSLANLLPMLGSGTQDSNLATNMGLPGNFGGKLGDLGKNIANIGNAASGVIPPGQTPNPTSTIPMPNLRNGAGSPMGAPIQSSPTQIQSAVNTAGNTTMPVAPSVASGTTIAPVTASGTVPYANGVPVGSINGGDFNSVYGVDTGTALTNLYNSENQNSANSTAQAIINANAPNVAQGAAGLNTALAASGISPSSSVSAIENANYGAQVQQQNLAEEANVSLTEQQMQQQLLESLLPGQQQRQTDSSGWSIFGDVMSGIGDVFGL